ncbi:hypothetical protein Salat_1127000 [Sesamum alatum]|uniref:Uncharacterized protein n=1 Tax=Sesamum alatum TaxID=300844 RepID=A0AAE1YDK5_9LAMI|nr:hypothetical protein Salat_1127000 [Sesamum alatum]
MDRCFIRELVHKVQSNSSENRQPNADVVCAVISVVNVVFSVCWIPRLKLVLVNESLSEEIGWGKSFARAYRWETQRAWEELKIIFDGPEHKPNHPSDDELYAE